MIQQAGVRVFVRCVLELGPPDTSGLVEWSGSFVSVAPTPLLEAGEAILQLPKGLPEPIIINHIDIPAGNGAFVGAAGGRPPDGGGRKRFS